MSDTLGLFQGYGIEIEYMIVREQDLSVAPVADDLLTRAGGELSNEIERGGACWSNELVLHVIEFKSNGPLPSLDGAAELFTAQVREANALLAAEGCMLLPTGMHPWMDPHREMHLWPHDDDRIYRAFHRIFDCRGHGWANLQSVHINLPFDGDGEFARLHAAIRVLLPLLPALAASTPVMDGALSGLMDSRLAVYRNNCSRVPSITGQVIPEPVSSRADYRRDILEPMWRDIAPHDPDGILAEEWLNARGAIARFDRSAIEIRVLDVQENPGMDLAVVELVCAVVRALCEERWTSHAAQQAVPTQMLAGVFDDCVRAADRAPISSRAYLALFGAESAGALSAAALWSRLAGDLGDQLSPEAQTLVEMVTARGCLARRIARRLESDGESLESVYRRLADCLARGERFV